MTNCNNHNYLMWLYLFLLGAVVYHVWSIKDSRNLEDMNLNRVASPRLSLPSSSLSPNPSVSLISSPLLRSSFDEARRAGPIPSSPSQFIQPRIPINVPTRGFYGDFGLVGYLQPVEKPKHVTQYTKQEVNLNKLHRPGCRNTVKLNDTPEFDNSSDFDNNTKDIDRRINPEYMLRLYGRQIDSNRYEYYTTNHWDPQIKISLSVPRDEQLNDDDLVRVPGYGLYRVITYQQAYPGYI